jgi:surfactin synthase thioesterase subunit
VSGTAPQSSQPKLYIFPHAGASVDFYIPFSAAFSGSIKRLAVQYPRRGGGHDLPAMASISGLSDDIYTMLASDESARGTAFFAHSMGTLFAFEVARRFEFAGNPIAALFVSASVAPSRRRMEQLGEADSELLETVTLLTGLDPEFVGNERFADTVLPSLRSLKAIADYVCPPGATVSCPIYAFLGDDDSTATYENVAAWAEHTTSDFAIRVFRGGHHYINDNRTELAGDIEQRMSQLCQRGRRDGPGDAAIR